jgi:hypothetical protein
MHVLHYSFSLSACPKCHLLICQHTSLADLNFNALQTIPDDLESPYQQRMSHGTNVYMFSSSTPDARHSWTTFGTDSTDSTRTLQNPSSDQETVSNDAVPFADEHRVYSSLLLAPVLNPIDRTQSERVSSTTSTPKLSIEFTKSLSYSTICRKSTSCSHLNHTDQTLMNSATHRSFLPILLILLSFLITNTIDIVLVYIYSRTNYLFLISFISTIILCDMIFWLNNLLELHIRLSYLLLIPLIYRFHLLYDLIELLIIALDKNEKRRLSNSASTTTTTFETNTSQSTDIPMMDYSSAYPTRKQRLFRDLSLFYLVHTGLFALINFYFWSNNFQLSSRSSISMDYFIPRWTVNEDVLFTDMNTALQRSSTAYVQ